MCPPHAATTLAERYDLALIYARDIACRRMRPVRPTKYWPEGNLEFLARYQGWLLDGGVSEMVTNTYYIPMAGHWARTDPHPRISPDKDLDRALWSISRPRDSALHGSKTAAWPGQVPPLPQIGTRPGEESKITPFDVSAHMQGLPLWLVNELERYQRIQQRNWRTARIDLNLRGFWSKHGHLWRFLVEQRGVQKLKDLKRQFVLDYLDVRLSAGLSARTVNGELRIFHTFLLFLQEEGYTAPNSLLRIPGPKVPDPLPKYLTDEQVKKLRDEFERAVREAVLGSKKRIALLDRAAFYLLWQGGLRLGEVEELRLADLDLGQRRLSVRDGKGRVDRTVFLAKTAIHAVQEYLAVRGAGSGDHVFLYRNAPLKKDLIHARLKCRGTREGVKVYPHRLRHTCATQLLNAGCRITSIQASLGHKKLNTTMIYARAHDQTVADDYFAAMRRIEQRLDISPAPEPEPELKLTMQVLKSRNTCRF